MSNINHQFLCIPIEVISSGLWGQLSNPARSLYPALLRFSNSKYKPVWPGTDELLRLTGFKSKKSLQIARHELKGVGLIDFVPGTGRTSTRYFFGPRYHPGVEPYAPLREIVEPPTQVSNSTPAGYVSSESPGTGVPPNHINITITNNQKTNQSPTANENKLDDESVNTKKLDSLPREQTKINPKHKADVWQNLAGNRRQNLGLVSELESNWSNLAKLLDATATENTLTQFQELRPVELEDGSVMVFGQCSGHLQRLVEAKFPGIRFEELSEVY